MYVPTLFGDKHETPRLFPSSVSALARMWGHSQSCGCTLCTTFSRVFSLVREGTGLPGFVPLASGPVRVLEGELRDTVEFCIRQNRAQAQVGGAPLPPPVAASSPLPPPAVPLQEPEKEGSGQGSQVEKAKKQPEHNLYLTAKSKPSSPVPAERSIAPKSEPLDSPGVLVDVAEEEQAEGVGEEEKAKKKKKRSQSSQARSAKPSKPKKDKRKSRSRSRRRRDKEGSSSPKRSKSRRRRRSTGDRGSPREERGRERRTRPEESPARKSPLRPRSPPYPPGPRSPSRPPPGYEREQGPGWRGQVPYSSHPRWTSGANKGVVKRAKQERYNSRRG